MKEEMREFNEEKRRSHVVLTTPLSLTTRFKTAIAQLSQVRRRPLKSVAYNDVIMKLIVKFVRQKRE